MLIGSGLGSLSCAAVLAAAGRRVTVCESHYRRVPLKASIWVFPKIVVPQNPWFIMETPIKMDDLGVPLFSETPIRCQTDFGLI